MSSTIIFINIPVIFHHIDQTRYIGEIGLDNYNKKPSDYNIQKKVFEKIVSTCRDKENKILTVHSRRATNDVISIIGQDFPGKVILHWYSGGLKDLNTALEYGLYFSVNYSMTQSDSGKKIISAIPMDRILLETDGPFIEYENLPSTPFITKTIAEYINLVKKLNLEPAEIELLFNNNFKNLLS